MKKKYTSTRDQLFLGRTYRHFVRMVGDTAIYKARTITSITGWKNHRQITFTENGKEKTIGIVSFSRWALDAEVLNLAGGRADEKR